MKQLKHNKDAMNLLAELVNNGISDADVKEALKNKFGINWSLNTIRRNRRNIGINKNKKDFLHDSTIDVDSLLLSLPPPNIGIGDQAEWFRSQFKKTHLYRTLKTQLTIDEIDIYIEEYGGVCCQFKDIVTSEFFQIDDFLKHRILINRQLTVMKNLQTEIDTLSTWVAQHPFDVSSTKEEKQLYMNKIGVLGDLRKDLAAANDRYDKLGKERKTISDNLAATRRDRLEDLRGGREDFFRLIAELQLSEDSRNEHGRLAELCKISLNETDEKLHESIKFEDGEIDSIILDDQYMVETENEDF